MISDLRLWGACEGDIPVTHYVVKMEWWVPKNTFTQMLTKGRDPGNWSLNYWQMKILVQKLGDFGQVVFQQVETIGV